MEDIFARLILGHLMGDYLLQSKRMALQKSVRNINGFGWCLFHAFIYTACICLFLWRFDLLLVVLVFLSHYPIDRWSLSDKWLKLIGGRDLVGAYLSKDKFREFDIGFSCVVYAITDNSLHLILLWLITKVV